MSDIESNSLDPGKAPLSDVIYPTIDPQDDFVGSDDVREPDRDRPAIEPDPEEGRKDLPNIRHALQHQPENRNRFSEKSDAVNQ